jgi:hypothetical protein
MKKNKLKYSSVLKLHFSLLLYVIDLRRYLNLKYQNDCNETLYYAQRILYAAWYLVTAFCVDEASHSSCPVGAGGEKIAVIFRTPFPQNGKVAGLIPFFLHVAVQDINVPAFHRNVCTIPLLCAPYCSISSVESFTLDSWEGNS